MKTEQQGGSDLANKKGITKFGRKLEAVLETKNMSPSDLAKKLKTSDASVYFLKRTEKPRSSTLKKLSKCLGKPVEFWLDSTSVREPASVLTKAPSRAVKVYIVVEVGGQQRRFELK